MVLCSLLHGQEVEPEEETETAAAPTTGEPAMESVHAASSNSWKNWTFAGALLIGAGVAIYFVSTHSGEHAPSD
ncbi:MAG: hypothetical protein KGQ49_04480 [Verrucomicrobia bacterium]|nr:hypothetical protein [Verrucomicrobiota bacterium]